MLFAANVDAPGKIKDALKPAHPAIRSQHSCEAIAAGLGFRTYNGLRAALDAAVADWDPVPNVPGTVCCHIDGGAFRERIQTLAGIDVPSGAFLEAILRACPAMACGENIHERLLVAIADGLAANYFRRLLGSRYVPISAAFEFVRFAHDPDCPVSWNNGVATNVLFHNTGNRLFPAFKLPSGEDGFRFLFHDRDTVLPLYWREIAAMSHLAREAEQAIAGDLARLPGCGRLFEMTWARPIVIDAEAACCEVKLRAK